MDVKGSKWNFGQTLTAKDLGGIYVEESRVFGVAMATKSYTLHTCIYVSNSKLDRYPVLLIYLYI